MEESYSEERVSLPGDRNFQLEELTHDKLEEQVQEGIFYKTEHHKEHFAVHPYWLTRPKQGVFEELRKTLGKWNTKLQAYVVGFDKVTCDTTSAAINEDHKWLHFDIFATFYLYKPEEGQTLKGVIRKIGNNASICILFKVFSATVFAENEEELSSWSLGDEISFQIYSIQNRRKGPIIRAQSTGSNSNPKEDWEMPKIPSSQEDWETPAEVTKKRKKKKKKSEPD